MDVSTKRKRSIVDILIAIVLIVCGYFCMDSLAPHFLNVRNIYRKGVVYYYADNSYQWCTWLTVVGAFLVVVGLARLSSFVSAWSKGVYERFQEFKRIKLALFCFYLVCLNAFTLDFFVELGISECETEILKNSFSLFNKYNIIMAFAFGILLFLFICVNSSFDGAIKYVYYPACILIAISSVIGMVIKAKEVRWLLVIYSVGIIIVALWLIGKQSRVKPGIGFAKKPEVISENIGFFASSHGLGHIMRMIPVIEYILKTTDCNIVLVCDEEKLKFAKGYLENQTGIPVEYLDEHVKLIAMNTDFGIRVKEGSLLIDAERVEKGVVDYISEVPALAYQGVEIIDDYELTKIVGDITPFVFSSASFRQIPSILMLSFTWIEIYQEHIAEALIKPYREMFGKATKVLRYALCNRVSRMAFPDATDVGFVARPINKEHVREIKNSTDKPIVFFSIGLSNSGIDKEMDVSNLPYTFVITKGVGLKGDNVISLDLEQYDAQDYVAASKFCIIKSGWTTIAECMIAGRPMALLGRDDVAEDRMSIEMLVGMNRGIKIDVSEIASLDKVLERMENTHFDETPMANDYAHIAEEIINYH